MNQNEQHRFVTNLSSSVVKTLLADIEAGKVPEEWEHQELRQLLADRFAFEVFELSRTRMKQYRAAKYNNRL